MLKSGFFLILFSVVNVWHGSDGPKHIFRLTNGAKGATNQRLRPFSSPESVVSWKKECAHDLASKVFLEQ